MQHSIEPSNVRIEGQAKKRKNIETIGYTDAFVQIRALISLG